VSSQNQIERGLSHFFFTLDWYAIEGSNTTETASGYDRTPATAFRQRKQVIIPLPVSVRSDVGGLSSIPANFDVCSVPVRRIDRVETLPFRFDSLNGRFPGDSPTRCSVPDVGDVFVSAFAIWLGDTGDKEFLHDSIQPAPRDKRGPRGGEILAPHQGRIFEYYGLPFEKPPP